MSEFNIDFFPPVSSGTNHNHDLWEIALCLQGTGNYIINNEKIPYTPGFIICVPPGIYHQQFTDETFTNICIISPSFILDRSKENRVYFFQDDSSKSIETLMLMCHRVFLIKDANYENIVASLYKSIEHVLFSWHQNTPDNVEVEVLINKLIGSFNDPELALNSFFSESVYCNDHLRRIFKQETGKTPHSYLTDLRLNYAERLLAENKSQRYSINDISLMSGFYDSRYFSRLFKKKNGKTPSEFIRETSKF